MQLVNISKVFGHLRKAVTSCHFMSMDTDNYQTVSNDQGVKMMTALQSLLVLFCPENLVIGLSKNLIIVGYGSLALPMMTLLKCLSLSNEKKISGYMGLQ